jgi:hypothetical protein
MVMRIRREDVIAAAGGGDSAGVGADVDFAADAGATADVDAAAAAAGVNAGVAPELGGLALAAASVELAVAPDVGSPAVDAPVAVSLRTLATLAFTSLPQARRWGPRKHRRWNWGQGSGSGRPYGANRPRRTSDARAVCPH